MSARTALVYGGSAGIGFAVAARLAADHRVVIAGRRPDQLKKAAAQLQEQAGGAVRTLVSDLADPDPAAVLEYYIAHRAERLDQVRAALAAGDRTPAEIVTRVYTEITPAVRPAAELSVQAQLDYLASTGELPAPGS